MPSPANKKVTDRGSVVTASDNGGAKGICKWFKKWSKAKPPVVGSDVGDPQAKATRHTFVRKKDLCASSQSTSFVLLKVPSHILLGHEGNYETERSNFSFERQGDDGNLPKEFGFDGWMLMKTCLQTSSQLHRRVMLSFGVVCTLMLLIMMV